MAAELPNPDAAAPDVLMADFQAEVRAIRAEVDAAVTDVLDSGWFVLGKQGRALESEFAAYLGPAASPPHVAGCASGTEALTLALRAVGIGPGDRVLTVPNTCAPTATGIRMTGADLGFVDVDPTSLLMDPDVLARELERRPAQAVMPVHLYGNLAPVMALGEIAASHGAKLIEDCAQAHGARLLDATGPRSAGTFGDAAAFSFYPSKNLGAFGDGGAVATNDPEAAERITRLRNYGYAPERRDWATEEGWNSRLDEMQAAILRVRLRHLEASNERRRAVASRFDDALVGLPHAVPVPVPQGTLSARHLYPVRTGGHREALRAHLTAKGIRTQIHYPDPLHRHPAFAGLQDDGAAPLTVSEQACTDVLSLPLHPHMDDAQVARVVDAVQGFAAGA